MQCAVCSVQCVLCNVQWSVLLIHEDICQHERHAIARYVKPYNVTSCSTHLSIDGIMCAIMQVTIDGTNCAIIKVSIDGANWAIIQSNIQCYLALF